MFSQASTALGNSEQACTGAIICLRSVSGRLGQVRGMCEAPVRSYRVTGILSEGKNDPGWYTAGEHVVDARVDVLELTLFRDDPGASDRVQREDIDKILTGADDGADDRFPAEHRIEDRDGHVAVSGQPDADEPTAAAE